MTHAQKWTRLGFVLLLLGNWSLAEDAHRVESRYEPLLYATDDSGNSLPTTTSHSSLTKAEAEFAEIDPELIENARGCFTCVIQDGNFQPLHNGPRSGTEPRLMEKIAALSQLIIAADKENASLRTWDSIAKASAQTTQQFFESQVPDKFKSGLRKILTAQRNFITSKIDPPLTLSSSPSRAHNSSAVSEAVDIAENALANTVKFITTGLGALPEGTAQTLKSTFNAAFQTLKNSTFKEPELRAAAYFSFLNLLREAGGDKDLEKQVKDQMSKENLFFKFDPWTGKCKVEKDEYRCEIAIRPPDMFGNFPTIFFSPYSGELLNPPREPNFHERLGFLWVWASTEARAPGTSLPISLIDVAWARVRQELIQKRDAAESDGEKKLYKAQIERLGKQIADAKEATAKKNQAIAKLPPSHPSSGSAPREGGTLSVQPASSSGPGTVTFQTSGENLQNTVDRMLGIAPRPLPPPEAGLAVAVSAPRPLPQATIALPKISSPEPSAPTPTAQEPKPFPSVAPFTAEAEKPASLPTTVAKSEPVEKISETAKHDSDSNPKENRTRSPLTETSENVAKISSPEKPSTTSPAGQGIDRRYFYVPVTSSALVSPGNPDAAALASADDVSAALGRTDANGNLLTGGAAGDGASGTESKGSGSVGLWNQSTLLPGGAFGFTGKTASSGINLNYPSLSEGAGAGAPRETLDFGFDPKLYAFFGPLDEAVLARFQGGIGDLLDKDEKAFLLSENQKDSKTDSASDGSLSQGILSGSELANFIEPLVKSSKKKLAAALTNLSAWMNGSSVDPETGTEAQSRQLASGSPSPKAKATPAKFKGSLAMSDRLRAWWTALVRNWSL